MPATNDLTMFLEGTNSRPMNVILVDGTCIFCNRLVSFILRHDRARLFHFAHLQGSFARAKLAQHGLDANDLDSVYVVMDARLPSEKIAIDGAAGREIWPRLFWPLIFMRWLPLPILNAGYRWFARNRYGWFGQDSVCIVPSADDRKRFVTDESAADVSIAGLA